MTDEARAWVQTAVNAALVLVVCVVAYAAAALHARAVGELTAAVRDCAAEVRAMREGKP